MESTLSRDDALDPIDRETGIAFLMEEGDLLVPCSRYGRHTSDCAEVAWRVAEIMDEANGDGISRYSLEHDMGLVVNDHDDVAYLLATYGTDEEREEWAEYAENDT